MTKTEESNLFDDAIISIYTFSKILHLFFKAFKFADCKMVMVTITEACCLKWILKNFGMIIFEEIS